MRKMVLWLAPMLAVVALFAVPAYAFQYEHTFCENNMEPDGTCPPNGSSEWAHLEVIEGDAGGLSHETCIDAYESNKEGYTAQKCMYYAGEEARETPHGEYGYPRAWNGGTVKHVVDATEYGYHTS